LSERASGRATEVIVNVNELKESMNVCVENDDVCRMRQNWQQF
jgi:hypothetical protein